MRAFAEGLIEGFGIICAIGMFIGCMALGAWIGLGGKLRIKTGFEHPGDE